jgi:uncharacterized membrane protein (UPF0127 family)
MGKEKAQIRLMSIAETPAAQELGLQYVRQMPEMTGMAFRFSKPRVLSFYMKNTYLPLDILFADSDGKIVKIERMLPLSMSSVTSGKPCILAVEVLAGSLSDYNVSEGDTVSIDDEGKTATFNG